MPRFASDISPPLDPVLGLVVVHGFLSLSQEGVHALIRAQEPVHAHDGLEGQDAAERRQRSEVDEGRGGVVCVDGRGGRSPFHEVDHVDDARRADHWLVGEDGPHGLLHAELWLEGRQERLDFLPGCGKQK